MDVSDKDDNVNICVWNVALERTLEGDLIEYLHDIQFSELS